MKNKKIFILLIIVVVVAGLIGVTIKLNTSSAELESVKSEKELKAIYEIIEGLIDYNGIANYDNIKPYTIDIDYYYDYENKCYKYKFTISEVICGSLFEIL